MPVIFRVYTRVQLEFSAYAIKMIKKYIKKSLISRWVDGYSGSSTTPARGQLFPTAETTWRDYKKTSYVWPKGRENYYYYTLLVPYPSLKIGRAHV